MYLGARVMLWSGAVTWACEPSVFDAWEFSSIDDATTAAAEVLQAFEWNTPAARDRIVEVIDASGVTVRKIGMRANGVGALRLM